jgi:hypothetical protein
MRIPIVTITAASAPLKPAAIIECKATRHQRQCIRDLTALNARNKRENTEKLPKYFASFSIYDNYSNEISYD